MSGEEVSVLERDIQHVYFSRRDFHKTTQFLGAAIACDNAVVREALLISAIISYNRPFSNTAFRRPNASTRLLTDLASERLPDASRDMHNKVLALSKRAVNGFTPEAAPVELEASRRGRSLRMLFTPHRTCSGNWTILREELDLSAFIKVAEEMQERCSEQLLVLSEQLADALPVASSDELHALMHEDQIEEIRFSP
ncbi:MAG TPA: hypothetical protein VHZ99_00925 [Steroidobacteraceae bacterium]|jgi:hypothetical protein|nr:hypothetical protein [Steroidobacteraceae bacterium]